MEDVRRDSLRNHSPSRDVFGDDSHLWEPGEKEVRNPSIAMAMRRIAMCEQAGTGLRMMRETWRKLGHPSPIYKNDRAGKAFELFIPELDKEAESASDLMKAQVEMPEWRKNVLAACSSGEKTGKELLLAAGYRNRTGNFKKGIQSLLDERLLELTIPDKPNSRLQKYRLIVKGRQMILLRFSATTDMAAIRR